jgi:hypothetical protein
VFEVIGVGVRGMAWRGVRGYWRWRRIRGVWCFRALVLAFEGIGVVLVLALAWHSRGVVFEGVGIRGMAWRSRVLALAFKGVGAVFEGCDV